MLDGVIRSGADIASSLASRVQFTFLGGTPTFGTCAMGHKSRNQALETLKRQVQYVMEQVGCEKVEDLPFHLIK